jgi:hypothetical protein
MVSRDWKEPPEPAYGCLHTLSFEMDEVVEDWQRYIQNTLNKVEEWDMYCVEEKVVVD